MKKISCGALLLFACLSAPSWAQRAQLQVIPTEPFDSIEISGSADVRFTQGPTDQVMMRGGDDALREEIDHALARRRADIRRLLDEYGVPSPASQVAAADPAPAGGR